MKFILSSIIILLSSICFSQNVVSTDTVGYKHHHSGYLLDITKVKYSWYSRI
jgi:hypothetical protein